MSARLPPPIVALSPGDLDARGADALVRKVRGAFEAGLRGVVLREAALADGVYSELAEALRAVVDSSRDGWLCLHDRPHLAAAVGADAVHLGGCSLAPRAVRAWLAPTIAIGLSTHAGDDPEAWLGADYLFHGPCLPTSKVAARSPIGFEGLARATAASARPIWALGGLRPEHAGAVHASGARGMAVLSGILAQPDAAATARAYVEAWALRCA